MDGKCSQYFLIIYLRNVLKIHSDKIDDIRAGYDQLGRNLADGAGGEVMTISMSSKVTKLVHLWRRRTHASPLAGSRSEVQVFRRYGCRKSRSRRLSLRCSQGNYCALIHSNHSIYSFVAEEGAD